MKRCGRDCRPGSLLSLIRKLPPHVDELFFINDEPRFEDPCSPVLVVFELQEHAFYLSHPGSVIGKGAVHHEYQPGWFPRRSVCRRFRTLGRWATAFPVEHKLV